MQDWRLVIANSAPYLDRVDVTALTSTSRELHRILEHHAKAMCISDIFKLRSLRKQHATKPSFHPWPFDKHVEFTTFYERGLKYHDQRQQTKKLCLFTRLQRERQLRRVLRREHETIFALTDPGALTFHEVNNNNNINNNKNYAFTRRALRFYKPL